VAAGHYRNGVLLTPVTAALVAAAASGEPMPAFASPFLPGRGTEPAAAGANQGA